ncbi:MAG: hypothetical protein ABEK59_10390 [Halobacteria archaeon]
MDSGEKPSTLSCGHETGRSWKSQATREIEEMSISQNSDTEARSHTQKESFAKILGGGFSGGLGLTSLVNIGAKLIGRLRSTKSESVTETDSDTDTVKERKTERWRFNYNDDVDLGNSDVAGCCCEDCGNYHEKVENRIQEAKSADSYEEFLDSREKLIEKHGVPESVKSRRTGERRTDEGRRVFVGRGDTGVREGRREYVRVADATTMTTAPPHPVRSGKYVGSRGFRTNSDESNRRYSSYVRSNQQFVQKNTENNEHLVRSRNHGPGGMASTPESRDFPTSTVDGRGSRSPVRRNPRDPGSRIGSPSMSSRMGSRGKESGPVQKESWINVVFSKESLKEMQGIGLSVSRVKDGKVESSRLEFGPTGGSGKDSSQQNDGSSEKEKSESAGMSVG